MEMRISQSEIYRPLAIGKRTQTRADLLAAEPGQAEIGKVEYLRMNVENELIRCGGIL